MDDVAAVSDISDTSDTLAATRPMPRCAGRYWLAVVLFLFVGLGVLAGDQALKYISFQDLSGGQIVHVPGQGDMLNHPAPTVTVIPGILSLKLTINAGAVFGIGQGRRWLFIAVSLIAAIAILIIFYRSRPRRWVSHIGLALILAGALGNLYDRIVFGAVRDMLWLLPGTGLWPWVFNLADASLLTGVAVMLLMIWHDDRHRSTSQKADD